MLRVATIQMVSGNEVEANLRQAATLLQQAADAGAGFALLPEYFPLISDIETDKLNIVEAYGDGPIQNFLADKARRHQMWVMGGAIPLRSDEAQRVASSCLLYNPAGECIARYDKMHLFDVCVNKEEGEAYQESSSIVAGRKVVTATTDFATFGLSICYDLRFPELYREMVKLGATILTVPSAFTYSTGRRHWQMLLSARAVENLCFVIAANQGGQNTAKRRTWGHSMIIDPWGNILAALEAGPGIACADIDLTQLQELRTSFPALEHRILGL